MRLYIADWDEWASYYGELDELHMPFNFSLLWTPWTAQAISEQVNAAEAVIPEGGWPSYVLGNHDNNRIATRFGEDQMPLAAMLLLTLRGAPTLYYGDELAIPESDIPPEEQQDPHGRLLAGAGRDGCRTPMQWDDSFQAGFSPPVRTRRGFPLPMIGPSGTSPDISGIQAPCSTSTGPFWPIESRRLTSRPPTIARLMPHRDVSPIRGVV